MFARPQEASVHVCARRQNSTHTRQQKKTHMGAVEMEPGGHTLMEPGGHTGHTRHTWQTRHTCNTETWRRGVRLRSKRKRKRWLKGYTASWYGRAGSQAASEHTCAGSSLGCGGRCLLGLTVMTHKTGMAAMASAAMAMLASAAMTAMAMPALASHARHAPHAPPCYQHTANASLVLFRRQPSRMPTRMPTPTSAMAAHVTAMPAHAPPARRGLMTTRTSRSSTTRHSTHPTVRPHTRTGGGGARSWRWGAQRAGERREGT